jgi:hypothetical protein
MAKYCGLLLLASFFLLPAATAQNAAKFSDIQPGMVDGEIEQRAIKIANQRAVDLRCPEDYTKAVIISRKWTHELNRDGFVTGRVIHLELYCERPEGNCGMADFVFKQKYTDEGAYSRKLYFVSMGDTFAVDCEP